MQAAPRQSVCTAKYGNGARRCTPCRQRRGKDQPNFGILWQVSMHPVQAAPRQRKIAFRNLVEAPAMHPVQAAPRQRSPRGIAYTSSLDAPRAGSAEAKTPFAAITEPLAEMHPVQAAPRQSWATARCSCCPKMHPVQAAPRQRRSCRCAQAACADAPRAGSAEAKHAVHAGAEARIDAPRAGSAEAKNGRVWVLSPPAGCTPCRQRRGKGLRCQPQGHRHDAPRAGSAEAKIEKSLRYDEEIRCTPCRQRRGKVKDHEVLPPEAHDAPRAGSAEAKFGQDYQIVQHIDAPRAGSAEAKDLKWYAEKLAARCTPCRQRRGKAELIDLGAKGVKMHPVQAAPRQRFRRTVKPSPR